MDSFLSANLLEWLVSTPSEVDTDVGPTTCQLSLTDHPCFELVSSTKSAHAFVNNTEETCIDNLLQAALDSKNTAPPEPSDGTVQAHGQLSSPAHSACTWSHAQQLLGLKATYYSFHPSGVRLYIIVFITKTK